MCMKDFNYEQYDRIIEGLVAFWLTSRPRPKLEYDLFCDFLEQHLLNALDDYRDWLES